MQQDELQPGIYVMRECDGAIIPLRLTDQNHYREWVGCFSAYPQGN